MTRVGWIILTLFLLAALAFGSMVSFGTTGQSSRSAPSPEPTAGVPGQLMVPVAGIRPEQLTDTWGQDRGGGTRQHHAIDIMAAGGTPVIAAAPGTVEKLFHSEAGGTTLYVRSPDAAWSYYYAHLAGYAPGVHEGKVVRAGETLGFVGDTGNAGTGNYHLHFAIARMRAGESWYGGEPVNPYPILASGRLPR